MFTFHFDTVEHAQKDAYDTYLRYLIAGEDLPNNVLRVAIAPLVSASYSPSNFSGFGAVTKANVKASAGSLLSVYASNTNAAVRYLQLHNKASAPTEGEKPVASFPIPAGTALIPGTLLINNDFFNSDYFSAGISWAISTTGSTFTDAATASEHFVNGMFL